MGLVIQPRNYVIAEIKRSSLLSANLSDQPDYYFYDSLVVLDNLQSGSKENAPDLKRVKQNQTHLKQSGGSSGAGNYYYKFELVEAEKNRVLGNRLVAIEHYDRAISAASEDGLLREEATAHELAAGFYFDWGKDKFALVHLKDAYRCYCDLDAHDKANHLRKLLDEAIDATNIYGNSYKPSRNLPGSTIAVIENKYRTLVEGAVDVIWSSDVDGTITYLSPQFESLTGFRTQDWVGRNSSDLVHPDDQGTLIQNRTDMLERGIAADYELRHRRRDGTYVWVMIRTHSLYDSAGCEIGHQGIIRDITDLREAEIALKNKETQLHRISENSPGMLYRIVRDSDCNLQFAYVGSQVREIFELEPEVMLSDSQTFWDRINPDDKPRVMQAYKDSAETLKPFTTVYRLRIPTTETRWLKSMAYAEKLENGDVAWDGVVVDISDLKRLEAEKNRQADIIENTSDYVGTYDTDGNNLYSNKALRKLPSNGSGVLAERPCDSPDWATDVIMNVGRPEAAKHGLWTGESALFDGDGNEFPVSQVIIAHKTTDNEVDYYSSICRDLTEQKKAELALEEATARMLRLTESVPGMIYQFVYPTERDGFSIKFLSSKCKEMFGVGREEALKNGSSLFRCIHPDDVLPLHKLVRSSLYTLESFTTEFRVKIPGEDERWLQSFGQLERLDNGSISLSGVTIDITAQKKAELAHNEMQAQVQRMTENVPGMIFRYVRQADGIDFMDYVSSKSRDLYEVEPEHALDNASNLFCRWHPDDIDNNLLAFENSAKQMTPLREEYRVILPIKGVCWRQVSGQPSRNKVGDTIWDGVVIDITQRKETELALQEAQTRLQRVTENVPGMIFQYIERANGIKENTYISGQCRDLFGIDPEDAIGHYSRLMGFVDPVHREQVVKAIEKSAIDLSIIRLEYRVVIPGRGKFWRQTVAHPSRSKEGDTIWDGIIIDVTKQKRAELQLQSANEELAKATRMKDEFLANMSHELRTPLSAILGINESLQRGIFGEVSGTQAEGFEIIKESGAHLLELINEVLDLAKIESGAIELEISEVDVDRLCNLSIQFVALQANQKGIELIRRVAPNLPALQTDEKRLRQILVNLLSNAVKFTKEGGKVTLTVDRIKKRTDEIMRFTVTDTGIGIEEAKVEELFEPFVQIESTLNREHDGTGLGLALVKQFTELLCGEVGVETKTGVGSCFHVDFPLNHEHLPVTKSKAETQRLEKVTQTPQRPVTSHTESVSEDFDHPLILMAEDNDAVAEATAGYLKFSNFRVYRVTNGDAALQAARSKSPDLILMDIRMPGVDGLEAIRRIKADQSVAAIPIIALTGLAMEGDSSRCISAGANHYLSKPYSMRELVDLVEQCLNSETTWI